MADYIMELRKIVGHRPLILVGGSVLVEDSEGRLLLQKRADNHLWGYCGGSAELDEAIEDTARRELLEETGLTALSLEFFGVFSGKETHCTYPNGDEASCVDIVYVCREYTGTLTPQESEVLDLQFFSWDQLPENISPSEWPAIRKWRQEKEAAAQAE